MPIEAEGLPVVRSSGPEREMLVEYLDYFRAVLRRKAEGIGDADLHRAIAPSTLTLGGLLRHMTVVELGWFRQTLLAEPPPEPWASAPWADDHDWELTSAPTVPTAQIFADFDDAITQSREAVATIAALDEIAANPRQNGEAVDLRWILIHMVEEYARHCGHADFIREAIDGATGD